MIFSTLLLVIGLFFCAPIECRKCFFCNCQYNWDTGSGSCASPTFLSSCTLAEVGDQYCLITSSYNGNIESRFFNALTSNILQDTHFIQAVETIAYSGTAWLPTAISLISYGCDWDGCNEMALAQYLPDSFRMSIDSQILTEALIGNQPQSLSCYDCSACINSLTASLCQSVPCANGTCFIDELHNYIVNSANNCTYNFFSFCETPVNSMPPPSLQIRATYYIDFPKEKQLEIDEVDMTCSKTNCNSIVVVENLKGEIRTDIVIPPGFQPSRPNSTTTVTTTTMLTTTKTSETERPGTSTIITTTSSSSTFQPIGFSSFILIVFFFKIVLKNFSL